MDKIFQIGFSKCGTSSLWHFFNNNNIKSEHWVDGKLASSMMDNISNNRKPFEGEFSDIVFYSDIQKLTYDYCIEGFKLFWILDKEYPNSKFILNTRQIDNWIRSCENHPRFMERLCAVHKVDRNRMIEILKSEVTQHHTNVKYYFRDRPEDLLVFNIEKDSPIMLKEFIKDYNLDISKWEQHNKTIY